MCSLTPNASCSTMAAARGSAAEPGATRDTRIGPTAVLSSSQPAPAWGRAPSARSSLGIDDLGPVQSRRRDQWRVGQHEEIRWLGGPVLDGSPGRCDEHVPRAPLEPLAADDRLAGSLVDDPDGAAHGPYRRGAVAGPEPVHLRAERRHDVAARDRVD